jgi:hypothetical protein
MKLHELTLDVRKAVIERNRSINVDHLDWWSGVCEQWGEELIELGYDDPEIQFSGFSSQGDGASFTSTSIPRTHANDEKVKEAWEVLKNMHALAGPPTEDNHSVDISRWNVADMLRGGVVRRRTAGNYVHENTVSVDWVLDDFPCTTGLLLEEHWDTLERALISYAESMTETVRSLCREIYADLEKEYEYRTSYEQVAQALEDTEFDEEGDET